MEMRVNEDVLRWVVKKQELPKLPSPKQLFHRRSKQAALLRPPPRPGQAGAVPSAH